MLRTNSLRFRVAFYYALFGALVSAILATSAYLVIQQVGHGLIDQILLGEFTEHASEPNFIPSNEKIVRGFVLKPNSANTHVPAAVRTLVPGRYNLTIAQVDYRILVAERDDKRFVLMYDTDAQHLYETNLRHYVVIFMIFMMVSSAAGGVILASRVTSSVTRLARKVSHADPEDMNLSLERYTTNDEVGDLARAFDRYMRRLREFVERENYFTADVSHELRTPLAIMLGSVEILEQDESLTQKQRERLTRIRRAAQDMIDLTAALLLMARERQVDVEESPCHLAEVAHSSIEKHRHLIGGRPIKLELQVSAEPTLIVERPLLEVVISNLIRNALANTKSGAVVLRLQQDRFSLQDTGVGMRPEELARAMERYYKGASSAGSGVGLSLVKRICDRYGWTITLKSQQGEGTTVEIIFHPH